MSKNTDRPMGHGPDADGIEEYDNPLPDWYIGGFIATIVWAVVYFVNWHVLDDKSAVRQYQEEMAQARLQWPDLEKKGAQDSSPETLALGAETFASMCAACHAPEMTGKIGPNLIDTKWIHGGEFSEILATIEHGVPAMGMPTWGPIVGPKKSAALASFILSKNTGLPSDDPYGLSPPPGDPKAAQ